MKLLHTHSPNFTIYKWKTVFPPSVRVQSTQEQVLDALTVMARGWGRGTVGGGGGEQEVQPWREKLGESTDQAEQFLEWLRRGMSCRLSTAVYRGRWEEGQEREYWQPGVSPVSKTQDEKMKKFSRKRNNQPHSFPKDCWCSQVWFFIPWGNQLLVISVGHLCITAANVSSAFWVEKPDKHYLSQGDKAQTLMMNHVDVCHLTELYLSAHHHSGLTVVI